MKKQRNQVKSKQKQRGPWVITRVLSLIFVVLAILLGFQVLRLQILPMVLAIPMVAIVVTLSLVLFLLLNFRLKKGFGRVLCTLIVIGLSVAYSMGNYYVYKVANMFDEVTTLTDKTAHTISVLTPLGSGIESLSDLDDEYVGIVPSLDEVGTQKSLADIESKGIHIETYEYSNLQDLLYDMFENGNTKAVILSSALEGQVQALGTYDTLHSMVNVVHKTTYYTDRAQTTESLNRVKNITNDAFTILISGNDSYGSLAENSRSDVNMLVTINPKTQKVLMTSIPRDYYLPIACASGADNCPDGEFDKLTHTGLYGVETTDLTLEEAFGITINYYVRVNFSSLANLVDSLGGIDVYVEEGNEVDIFDANATQGVQAGWNHLEGERALAFARERHAYQDGDNQRVKNQQAVLEAMVKKISSPTMLTHFGSFVDALAGAFETNMPSEQILQFVRYQFAMRPQWEFESNSLYGKESTEFCVSLGDYAYSALAYQPSIDCAKEKIEAIIQGRSSTEVSDPDLVNIDESLFLYPEDQELHIQKPSAPVYTEPEVVEEYIAPQEEYIEPEVPDYTVDESYGSTEETYDGTLK